MKAGWAEVMFDEAFIDASAGAGKVASSEWVDRGRLAVIDQGDSRIAGYTDDTSKAYTGRLPALVFGDHTRRVKYVNHPFAKGADGVKVLAARDGFDPRFLYWYLSSVRLPDAGYSRHFKFLREIVVPRPPIEEQREIAGTLDAASRLKLHTTRGLSVVKSLRAHVFVACFGDPGHNPMGWRETSLGELSVRFSDGPFGSKLKGEHYVDHGVRVVRLQNIGVGEFDDRDKAFISEQHFESLRRHECIPGDVLIGTLGDPNLRACQLPPHVARAINKADCVQMRVDTTKATADYVVGLVNHPSLVGKALGRATGQTRTRISMGRLRELQVPVPPLELQEEYAEFMRRHTALVEAHRRRQVAVDTLFASLQHRAFSGAL